MHREKTTRAREPTSRQHKPCSAAATAAAAGAGAGAATAASNRGKGEGSPPEAPLSRDGRTRGCLSASITLLRTLICIPSTKTTAVSTRDCSAHKRCSTCRFADSICRRTLISIQTK